MQPLLIALRFTEDIEWSTTTKVIDHGVSYQSHPQKSLRLVITTKNVALTVELCMEHRLWQPTPIGMRLKWLADIPPEVRCQIYRHMFKDKIYKVHDPAAHIPYVLEQRLNTRWWERKIFQCSRRVYEEASAVALQTALYDVRRCERSNQCYPLLYLTNQGKDCLSQITRLVCHAGGAPQVLHLTRTQMSQLTNICRLQEVNICYNLRAVSEILGLSEPNTRDSFRAMYKKHLSNHLQDFHRLFAGSDTIVRLCSLRSSSEFKGECEMLCLRGKRIVVKLRGHNPTTAEKEIEIRHCLKQLLALDTLEVSFVEVESWKELPLVRTLDYETSLASVT